MFIGRAKDSNGARLHIEKCFFKKGGCLFLFLPPCLLMPRGNSLREGANDLCLHAIMAIHTHTHTRTHRGIQRSFLKTMSEEKKDHVALRTYIRT